MRVLYLLLGYVVTAAGLRVTMEAPLISVLRDQDVAIPCQFSEFSSGKTINVHWSQTESGRSRVVYNYIPGRPPDRTRLYMEGESQIQSGNATLHIPRVQFSDEGEYTCTVIVTPESKEGRSSLQVSAAPVAVLTQGDAISVELGGERSVGCEVSNFYPEDINILWVCYERNSSDCKVLQRGTCTGDTVTNADGTFNVTSHLTLYPTLEEDGFQYSCVVKHRSLREDLRKDFTLTVTEREDTSRTVAAAVIGTFIAVVLLFAAGAVIYHLFRKDAPSLSAITGNEVLTHMTRTTLTCHILNYYPKGLKISVGLKRRGEEMERIITERSPDVANDGGDSVALDVEQQSLMNGDVRERPLQLAVTALETHNRPRLLRHVPWQRLYSYSCQCSLHISPSVPEDHGAELSVHVSHPALVAELHQRTTLRVVGVPPTLLKIVSPAYMTHNELTTLTCPIIGFKPRTLQITWLRREKDGRETEVVTWRSDDGSDVKTEDHKVTENENEDQSYTFQSALTMRPSVLEDGIQYICRTFHPTTSKGAQQEVNMAVTAGPELDAIKQTQDEVYSGGKVYVGKSMKLSCKISSFFPKTPIKVTWYTEDGRSLSCSTTEPLADLTGRWRVTSTMTYCPTLKDLRKTFTCEVEHPSSRAPRTATWRLDDLVSKPDVWDIRCSPPTCDRGDLVTLWCDVSRLYPKMLDVQWYKGTSLMPADKCTKSFQEDAASGTFEGRVQLSFLADGGHHWGEFRMEMMHCGKPTEKTYRLLLRGFPVLEDIVSEPRDPSYGRTVILHCKVTTPNPGDVDVRWLRDEKPLEKGEEQEITQMDGALSCSLRITATALDYAKVYACSVKHKDMASPIQSKHCLALRDQAPRPSAISVQPRSPVAGKEAAFTVTLSGFSPDIRVEWFKGYKQFASDVVSTSQPQLGQDSLLTCSSTLRFTPQHEDHGVSIRYEATHSATKQVLADMYTLHLAGRTSDEPKARIPKADLGALKTGGIQCLTEGPRVGGDVTLTCYVDGRDADCLEFSWRKGMYPIDNGIVNKSLEDGSGSSSTITFRAQEEDRDCVVTCEVSYNLQTQEEHFSLKLQ